jgi:hypothetical protein
VSVYLGVRASRASGQPGVTSEARQASPPKQGKRQEYIDVLSLYRQSRGSSNSEIIFRTTVWLSGWFRSHHQSTVTLYFKMASSEPSPVCAYSNEYMPRKRARSLVLDNQGDNAKRKCVLVSAGIGMVQPFALFGSFVPTHPPTFSVCQQARPRWQQA